MKQKVVIIGVSYSSRLALARSIGGLDCEITIVAWSLLADNPLPIDGYSKYVSRVLFCPKEEKAFIQLLLDKCIDNNQKVILLPDCDFSVAVIDSHQNELRPFFLMPHINHTQNAIVEWSDKLRQKQLAFSLGLNVANSSTIDIVDGHFYIPDTINYPCFPKAMASVSGGKAGMFRCDSKNDLERALREIIKRKVMNTKVMVEDYMTIDNEYAVLGCSDGQSVSIPGVVQFIKGSQTQKGIALQGKVMPVAGFEKTIDLFKTFVQKIGFWGLFDIDFYESDGKFFFSELNLRYGGSGYSIVKMGVNLPELFINCCVGGSKLLFDRQVRKEAIFTNERICYNDLINGFITPSEYRHFVRTSDICFIKDSEDYRPFEAFRKMVLKAFINYWPKKVLRKKKR